MRILPLAVSAMTLLACISESAYAKTAKKKKGSSGFSTLEMLPEGSILNQVKVPRYDKEFNPISLLTADSLTVGDGSIIDALDVYIELYNKDESIKLRTHMERAKFDQKKSILTSTDKTVLQGDSFKATGTALTFKQMSQQGFLKGPASTVFLLPHKKPSTAMNLDNLTKPITSTAKKVVTGTLITTTAGMLMAERPALLSDAEVQQLDKQALSVKKQVSAAQVVTQNKIQRAAKINAADDKKMDSFLTEIGEGDILISDPDDKQAEKKGFDLPFPDATEGQETLTIKCDDGVYFDAKKGVLVYLKNVKLTNPDYKMSCSDELKIYLEPQKDGKASEDKKQLESTDKIKKIIGTGDIVFIWKDSKGKTYIARAAEAHYDARTETMILRGGFPSIQLSANEYFKSTNEDGYISIPINGNYLTSATPWETKIIIPKK